MALFSIPPYPGATSYNVSYADPSGVNPNQPNPLGTWTSLGSYTSTSNIYDSAGSQNLRLYRVQPVVSVVTTAGGTTSIPLSWYDPFSVAQSAPGVFVKTALLYDPQITQMLPQFRDFIGDNGVAQTASTSIGLDTGAGSGLLIANGSQTIFNLADMPDAVPVTVLEYSVSVQKNNLTLLLNTDYYVDYEAGQITFATAPLSTDTLNIFYTEVNYTNRTLNAAMANAVQRLASLGVNGFGVKYDNNVSLMQAPVTNQGLWYIIFLSAQTIINQAVIWAKAKGARAYKTADFSMDTAPTRILDGMSKQALVDDGNIKDAVDKYIRTATQPIVWGDFDSFLDTAGLLPSWSALYLLNFFTKWFN